MVGCNDKSGEDPVIIARRLLVAAAEDTGCGNPQAMPVAMAAHYAAKNIGLPECALHLSAATIFVTRSLRTKASAIAIWDAMADIEANGIMEVPDSIKDCHNSGSKALGRGSCHDCSYKDEYVSVGKKFYNPLPEEFNYSSYDKIPDIYSKFIRFSNDELKDKFKDIQLAWFDNSKSNVENAKSLINSAKNNDIVCKIINSKIKDIK